MSALRTVDLLDMDGLASMKTRNRNVDSIQQVVNLGDSLLDSTPGGVVPCSPSVDSSGVLVRWELIIRDLLHIYHESRAGSVFHLTQEMKLAAGPGGHSASGFLSCWSGDMSV